MRDPCGAGGRSYLTIGREGTVPFHAGRENQDLNARACALSFIWLTKNSMSPRTITLRSPSIDESNCLHISRTASLSACSTQVRSPLYVREAEAHEPDKQPTPTILARSCRRLLAFFLIGSPILLLQVSLGTPQPGPPLSSSKSTVCPARSGRAPRP